MLLTKSLGGEAMDREEFNAKYEVYIEPRFYGCELTNPKAIDYLDRQFQELIKIPKFRFQQIKANREYFSFYADNVPREKIDQIEENLRRIYNG